VRDGNNGSSVRDNERSNPPPPNTNGMVPARRRAIVGRGILLAVAVSIGVWGVLHHPRFYEWRYARMSFEALEKERAGRTNDPRLMYYQGRLLNRQERFADAEPLLRMAVGMNPTEARLRDAWAQSLLGMGQASAAYAQLAQFAGTNPNSVEAHVLLGKYYVTQRLMERAMLSFEKAVALDPNDGEAQSYLAGAYEAMGEMEKARQTAETAVRLRPKSSEDRLMLASLLTRAGRIDDARPQFERAAALEPDRALPHRELARFLIDKRQGEADRARAEQEARRAIALDPKDALAHLVLGRALLNAGRKAEAIGPLTEAATLDKDDVAAPKELASVLRESGNTAEAVKWDAVFEERQQYQSRYRQLFEGLRARPNDRNLHEEMAALLATRGDVEGCIHEHSLAQHKPVDAAPVLVAAVKDLLSAKQAEAALPLARRAVKISEFSPDAHEALGDVYLALGRSYQAGEAYNTAGGLMPSRSPQIEKKVDAFLAAREKNLPPAEVAYRKARRLSVSQVGPRKVTDEVEQFAREAVRLDAYNPEYYWFLMNALKEQNKEDEAIETCRKMLEIAPKFARGHALLATMLVDRASAAEGLKEVEEHLNLALTYATESNKKEDAETAAARHYGLGLLALKREQGAVAASEFRKTIQYAPGPPVTYYKLALAERMAGNIPAAERAMKLFQALKTDMLEQTNALSDIAQAPNDPSRYEKAIRLFESHGLPEQAAAIRAEGVRRFGNRFAVSHSKAGTSPSAAPKS
jgi:tetratricopeptide (TPR) repeat protein